MSWNYLTVGPLGISMSNLSWSWGMRRGPIWREGGYIFAKNLDVCSYWPHMKTFRPLKKTQLFFSVCGTAPRCWQNPQTYLSTLKEKYLVLSGFLLHEEKVFCGFNCWVSTKLLRISVLNITYSRLDSIIYVCVWFLELFFCSLFSLLKTNKNILCVLVRHAYQLFKKFFWITNVCAS